MISNILSENTQSFCALLGNRSFFLVSKKFDPSLAGSESIIGFLPEELQVYRNSGILMYITAIRTNGGDRRGQCGSGSEIFLNFLNFARKYPRTHSSVLIGSCEEGVEIDEQNIPAGEFGEIFIQEGKLHLRFLNYKNAEGDLVATISSDLRKLGFE